MTTDIARFVMPDELYQRYTTLRSEFEDAASELFPDDRVFVKLSAEARAAMIRQRDRLWTELVGIPLPAVPSQKDKYREASCVRCRDGGWLQRYNLCGEERVYRDPEPCPDCSPEIEARKERLLAYSGIPNTQTLQTFETFKAMKGTEAAYKSAKALVDGAQYFMLLIAGGYGNGKTHLAISAVREATKQGMRAKFVYMPDFISTLKRYMDSRGPVQETIEEVKAVTFLALDDLGAEPSSSWQASVVEEIVNHRYMNCLYTIVTTNKDIKTIPGPVLSRLSDAHMSRIVINEAEDYRKKGVVKTPFTSKPNPSRK